MVDQLQVSVTIDQKLSDRFPFQILIRISQTLTDEPVPPAPADRMLYSTQARLPQVSATATRRENRCLSDILLSFA
jgi:hypothetical protein